MKQWIEALLSVAIPVAILYWLFTPLRDRGDRLVQSWRGRLEKWFEEEFLPRFSSERPGEAPWTVVNKSEFLSWFRGSPMSIELQWIVQSSSGRKEIVEASCGKWPTGIDHHTRPYISR